MLGEDIYNCDPDIFRNYARVVENRVFLRKYFIIARGTLKTQLWRSWCVSLDFISCRGNFW